jgi:hypothetical protein
MFIKLFSVYINSSITMFRNISIMYWHNYLKHTTDKMKIQGIFIRDSI